MSHCQGYKDMNARRPKGASEIADTRLEWIIGIHTDPTWWTKYKGDRLAYIHRWAMVCRREARKRGLI